VSKRYLVEQQAWPDRICDGSGSHWYPRAGAGPAAVPEEEE